MLYNFLNKRNYYADNGDWPSGFSDLKSGGVYLHARFHDENPFGVEVIQRITVRNSLVYCKKSLKRIIEKAIQTTIIGG